MGSRSSKRAVFSRRKPLVDGLIANDIALQGKPLCKDCSEEDGQLANRSSASTRRDEADVAAAAEAGVIAGEDGEREVWAKKVDFLLSVIGFAVDLANVWRFPYLCYKNGGGAFLVPYTLMLILGGIPLFYMELALGQFNRKGAITCWSRICPLFRGVGYAVVLIAFYTDFFYNVIIAWSFYYFFASFTLNLPWTTCNNSWNTPSCYDGDLRTDPLFNDSAGQTIIVDGITTIWTTTNVTSAAAGGATVAFLTSPSNVTQNITIGGTSPALEYFERGMLELQHAGGIGQLGHIKWQLALCLLVVYLICYFSLWKGISTSGKVVWFTALFPYVVLSILLVRGVTLHGAADGIRYYLTPDFSKLTDSGVWVDAATQVFFSLGPGFGVLLAFASYNKFHNNVYWDALATSSINCMTSFWAGFVIFSVLGYMSKRSGKPIDKVATEGPGLVFVVYPEAIATLPFSTFWSLIFFLMLITLGLDSSFGGSEAIITALSDEFPIVRNHREIFIACLFTFYFLIGLPQLFTEATASASAAAATAAHVQIKQWKGGVYIVTLMDKYAAGYSILFAVFFETLAISWLYGVDRFAEDISAMLGFRPGIYWRICWKFIAPIFILCIIVFGFVFYEPLKYDKYEYPTWANLIGWGVAFSSILCMPIGAIVGLIMTPGTLSQRFRKLIMPWRDTHKDAIVVNETRTNGSTLEVI